MTPVKLTCLRSRAHSPRMTGIRRAKRLVAMLGPGLIMAPLAGCITLEAPDEPIVIELNINITQEVIYRLAGDAEETIDANADIF